MKRKDAIEGRGEKVRASQAEEEKTEVSTADRSFVC